jgi:hypothetical protein
MIMGAVLVPSSLPAIVSAVTKSPSAMGVVLVFLGAVNVAAACIGAALIFLPACSAAQKQAEKTIAVDIADCGLRVALQDINRSPDAALKDAASSCGEQVLTDPDLQQQIINTFTAAQTSAVKAGAKLTYASSADAGQ